LDARPETECPPSEAYRARSGLGVWVFRELAVETWRRARGEAADLGSVGKPSVMSRRVNGGARQLRRVSTERRCPSKTANALARARAMHGLVASSTTRYGWQIFHFLFRPDHRSAPSAARRSEHWESHYADSGQYKEPGHKGFDAPEDLVDLQGCCTPCYGRDHHLCQARTISCGQPFGLRRLMLGPLPIRLRPSFRSACLTFTRS
jgi:hypothetical protein